VRLVVKPVLLLDEYSTTLSTPLSSRNPYLPARRCSISPRHGEIIHRGIVLLS
jgi:hypothetical protein